MNVRENRKKALLERYGEDHPGFGSYLECMSRANLTALSAFTIAFSFSYITQKLLKTKLPYSQNAYILTSTALASFAAYKVSKNRSAVCQVAWLATEEKNTYFTELEKSLSEKSNISTFKCIMNKRKFTFYSSAVNKVNFYCKDNKILEQNVKYPHGVLTIGSLAITSTSSHLYNKKYSTIPDDDDIEAELEDAQYQELVRRTYRIPDLGHQVYVIQPYIKWGKQKRRNTTPDLQLSEAVTLIKTLPRWKVVCTKTVSLLSLNNNKVFGKGNLETIAEEINSNKNITAVFLSINMLNPIQQEFLEDLFKIPVFDRYSIVVQIFKIHAKTSEAKLQVALGEIPYLWARLRYDHDDMSDKMGGGATIGGPGETYLELKKRVLQDKVRRLKMKLKKLKEHRALIRSKRDNLDIPTIAVVGYTNAGKTSLIKALTREKELKPRDVLFATLDVTVHAGYLPSGLKVLFVDTVGFLSDIPTNLVQSFVTTLEDAIQADLIIHIQDASHPDLRAQHDHVIDTLKSFNLSETLMENMITVSNKIDLVSDQTIDLGSSFPVSCSIGTGLDNLIRKVEDSIIKATGQILIKIRVPNGGEEYSWLFKEATVVKVVADEKDNQFAFLNTIISEANLNKFKHKFIFSKVL